MCKDKKKTCRFKVCRGDDGKFKRVDTKTQRCKEDDKGKFKKKETVTVKKK